MRGHFLALTVLGLLVCVEYWGHLFLFHFSKYRMIAVIKKIIKDNMLASCFLSFALEKWWEIYSCTWETRLRLKFPHASSWICAACFFFLFVFEGGGWMHHMHSIIVSIMNALIEQLNDLMQVSYMLICVWSLCCILQILVSCFVKTSHHEEYLCVKVKVLYFPP